MPIVGVSMTGRGPVRVSGFDAVKAAEAVLKQRRLDAWPYYHVYAPPDSTTVHEVNFIASPGAGIPTVVLSYKVPSGKRFVLRAILQVYLGGGAFNPGDALWTVTQNETIGSTTAQSAPVQGLVNVPIPLGSIAAGNQWPFARAYEFGALTVVRSVVETVNVGGVGFFASGFFGYTVPDVRPDRR